MLEIYELDKLSSQWHKYYKVIEALKRERISREYIDIVKRAER